MQSDYAKFLESKKQLTGRFGFEPTWFPDCAFDFQKEIISRAINKGRMGVFADTGLGKTLIELSIAKNIVEHTGDNVLILTPLAVAFQFVDEAEKIGVDDVYHSKDGVINGKIMVLNYERLHMVNHNDFGCVILDESSILKNFQGMIKSEVISFMRKVKYRFLASATPSPNDFTELGNSSEALGYLGYMDMLGRFFSNNQSSCDSRNRNIGEKFYLKPHAERDFFAWVNSWSVMIKRPSDIGFSDARYDLPELITHTHVVRNEDLWIAGNQGALFAHPAKTMTEVRNEQKSTVNERCEKAVSLAEGKTSVYWCNRNDESALLNDLDSDGVEICGSMSLDKKEGILMDFAAGNIERIITKARMTSMGLNWQHCNHTVFFPTWSYEQYYQAIRRFWRFGQTSNVTCDIVISEGQERVVTTLDQKKNKAIELYENLVLNVNGNFDISTKDFNKQIKKAGFMV